MMAMNIGVMKNSRGIALMIVLLVTALLIALVFEFAYGTRVSLRSAVNFRDSQRAYFLAQSGINYFKKNSQVRDYLRQGEEGVVPMVSGGDTELKVLWEDEAGKINLKGMAKNDTAYQRVVELFRNMGLSQNILDKIVDTSNPQLQFVTELHRYMSDDDYKKVVPYLTVNSLSGNLININYAAEVVLWSALPNNSSAVNDILTKRRDRKLTADDLTGLGSGFSVDSTVFKISSYARVGGYTKRIEVITNGTVVDYWKAL